MQRATVAAMVIWRWLAFLRAWDAPPADKTLTTISGDKPRPFDVIQGRLPMPGCDVRPFLRYAF